MTGSQKLKLIPACKDGTDVLICEQRLKWKDKVRWMLTKAMSGK